MRGEPRCVDLHSVAATPEPSSPSSVTNVTAKLPSRVASGNLHNSNIKTASANLLSCVFVLLKHLLHRPTHRILHRNLQSASSLEETTSRTRMTIDVSGCQSAPPPIIFLPPTVLLGLHKNAFPDFVIVKSATSIKQTITSRKSEQAARCLSGRPAPPARLRSPPGRGRWPKRCRGRPPGRCTLRGRNTAGRRCRSRCCCLHSKN